MEQTINKIQISPYSKVRIIWEDFPESYSKENEKIIQGKFAAKYGIPKSSIQVVFKGIKLDKQGNRIEIEGANLDSILDSNYQRELFKVWLDKNKKEVDFERIVKLDDKINSELNIDLNEFNQVKKYSLKWLMINNLLAFGEDNFISFDRLKGLTIINSIPPNQGGKTTFSIDAIKFLLFGTTTKTDKNEELFNLFTDKNELKVRGCLDIDNKEIIIERKLTRSAKKAGGWTIKNSVSYYEILPDGEEKELNEEDAKQTTKLINKTIGSEDDFELVTLATARNLEDLIDLGNAESGKMLSRLIGLEIIEKKEEIVRKKYNEFTKTMKSNQYNSVTLTEEIEKHKENIILSENTKTEKEKTLELTKEELVKLNEDKEKLLNSKTKIDDDVKSLNPSKLEQEIKDITEKGLTHKKKIEECKTKLTEIGTIEFDENKHHSLTKELNTNNTTIAVDEAEVKRLNKHIKDLESGEICTACNRKLDDIDNSGLIRVNQDKITDLNNNIIVLKNGNKVINEDLAILNEIKKKVDEKNSVELQRDRAEVEIGSLRNKIKEKQNDLKKYNLNLSAIDLNKKIDGEIEIVKTNINVANVKKDNLLIEIEKLSNQVKSDTEAIIVKTTIIEQIAKEEEVNKIYKIYIQMIGKDGISKLVLRSVLPIINSEIKRLLEDVCDFDVEIFIDDKNNVQYLLIKDGIENQLKSASGFERTASALALRCVLGKMSSLPMPNFITFDEIWGKVANVNIELFKPLFDKIKALYPIIFLISHNDLIRDWADNTITVVKENNISRLTIK